MTRVTRLNVGPRASGPPADVDLLRHLSERAHAERAPGQTQKKLAGGRGRVMGLE